MRVWMRFSATIISLLPLAATPALAQNAMGQIMTPFSTNTPSPPMAGQDGGQGGGGHDDGQDGGHRGPFHRPVFPFFVYPYAAGFIDDGGTASVRPQPVNTAPFAPPAPPAANDQALAGPYKPPSVEIAPGGIEIVRGPG